MSVSLVNAFPFFYVLIEKHSKRHPKADKSSEVMPWLSVYLVSEIVVESRTDSGFIDKYLKAHHCSAN